MAESRGGEIVSDDEAGKGGLTEVALWIKKVERSKQDQSAWEKLAENAIKIYEANDKDGAAQRFNIVHANIETLVPALYNSTPDPDVRRRYGDSDPVGKQVVDVIERALSFSTDQYDIDATIAECVRDAFLTGRATVRLKYKPQFAKRKDQQGEDYDHKIYEEAMCEPVAWNRWGYGPCMAWQGVPFVWFEHDLTEEDLEQIGVSDKRIEKLTFDDSMTKAEGSEKDKNAGIYKTVKAYEIWDAASKTIKFVTPQDKEEYLCDKPDEMALPGFFPVPKPLMPIRQRGTYQPLCPYEIYRRLVEELEAITSRIASLVDQLRVRGLIDSELAKDFERLRLCEDGHYEPATNALTFAQQAGGLDKAIAHWPLEPTIKALEQLYVQREQVKQTIYEVTGISDILRGETDANETLGAQQIKANYGGQRIQVRQADVANMVREIFRMKASLMCKTFSTDTLSMMTQIQITPEVEQVLRSDVMRSYRIDIETDSTIRADMSRAQNDINLFLQATAQYATSIGGIVQALPGAMPAFAAVYTAFARKFKLGKQAEDALDSLQEIAAKPQDKPSPEEQQMQMDQQRMQMQGQADQAKTQADMQAKATDAQIKQQQAQADMQARAAEHQMNLQMLQEKVAAQREELAMKREMMQMEMHAKHADIQIKRESAQIDLQKSQSTAEIAIGSARDKAALALDNGARP